MNINNLINYFAGADNAGKNAAKIDTLLEYNMLGQFLNGSAQTVNDEMCYVEKLDESDKQQLQNLYAGLKTKFSEFINSKEQIVITDNNAKQYSKILFQFELLENDNKIDELDKQNVQKVKQALYQYLLDNNYDLDGLQMDNINYDFAINHFLKNKEAAQKAKSAEETELTEAKKFKPNENLELREVDINTIMDKNKRQDGMFAIDKKGIKIVYDNGFYYSPEYPIEFADKNIYGLNFEINQVFVEKLKNEISNVINSDASEKEKKEYIVSFVNKFKDIAFGTDKEYLKDNGIKPGSKEYAAISSFKISFRVGDDYTPQFDYDAIYQDLLKKYSKN